LDPVWSPDGTQILFAYGAGENKRLYVVNRDSTNPHMMSSELLTRGRSDWSHDGKVIAAYSGLAPNREIYLMNSDGSNLHSITNGGNNLAPSFSPDGQWIVFTSYLDHLEDLINGCEIYIMQVDGTEVKRLTNNGYCDYQPRWGP
jgi:TolB protein